MEIDIFSSGESLLKHVKNQQENYQMIFLDIEMNGMNGIEVAKKFEQWITMF
ncbi:response regulator [Enterococcus termitis]